MRFLIFSVILIHAVSVSTGNVVAPSSCVINSFMRLERALTNMSWEQASVRTTLETTSKDMTMIKNNLQSTKKELESTKENLAGKTSRIDKLEKRILYLENVADKRSHKGGIAYQVRQIKHALILSDNAVLRFDDVTQNAGGAYNSRSGIFTTPVTGTYIFWANVMKDNLKGVDMTIKLIKKGTVLATGYTTAENRYGAATIIYLQKLQKGDEIWFATMSNPAGSRIRIHSYLYPYSYYGGALLTM